MPVGTDVGKKIEERGVAKDGCTRKGLEKEWAQSIKKNSGKLSAIHGIELT